MRYFKIETGIIIIFLLFGCSNMGKRNNNLDDIPTIIVPDLGVPDELYIENIDGLFDSIRFVPLETDSNCMIGEINKIEFYDDKFFILDWDITKTLFCYDKNGKFLYKINNVGKGPGEYLSLTDFSINEQKKELVLLDFRSQKIITYDFEGAFIKEINYVDKLGIRGISHIHIANRLTYVELDNPEPSLKKFVKIFDGTKEVGGFFKIDKHNWNIPAGFNSSFSRNKNSSFLYISKTSDIIYSINKYDFDPFYYVDFQGAKVSYKTINPRLDDYEKSKELLNQDSYRLNGNVFKADSIVYFSFSIGSMPFVYNCFFNEKNSDLIISHFVNDENDVRFNFIGYPLGVMGDAFIGSVSALNTKIKFEKLIEENKENVFDEKTRKILRSVSENDNPLIVVYK